MDTSLTTDRTRAESRSAAFFALPLAGVWRLFAATALVLAAITLVPQAQAPANAALPEITRSEIIARADYWYRASNGQVSGVAPFGRNILNRFQGYRTDCSGMVAMAWKLPAPGAASNEIGPLYGTPISVSSLQPGDVLGTVNKGHITMFHRWVNQATYTYMAYDFGGGVGGAGRMEYKQYQLETVDGSYAYRVSDSRQYRAYRPNHVSGGTAGDYNNPTGRWDGLQNNADGSISMWGWGVDLDTLSKPVQVHIYVTRSNGYRGPASVISANAYRPDVGSAYPGYGNYHGWQLRLGGLPAGSTKVEVYLIDTSGTANDYTPLGTRWVNVTW